MTEKCLLYLPPKNNPMTQRTLLITTTLAVFVVRLIVNVLSHSDTLRSHGRKVDVLFCQRSIFICISQKLTLITFSGSQGGLKMI